MQFDETKTYTNLARSFAGESQAGMRYQLIARAAIQQGYFTLADTVKVLAKNETEHARRFFEELSKHGEKLDNIDLDAGYPYHSGDLGECLKLAADDEHQEHAVIYPAFAKTRKTKVLRKLPHFSDLLHKSKSGTNDFQVPARSV